MKTPNTIPTVAVAMFSAKQLNLYTSKEGVQEAALAINTAFNNAKQAVQVDKTHTTLSAFSEFVGPVLNQQAKFGASDSDARHVISILYRRFVGNLPIPTKP